MFRSIKQQIDFNWILIFFFISISCGDKNKDPAPKEDPEEDQELSYRNPVFTPVLADPTIIRSGNFFYAYGTEDDWGSSGGYHLVPIIRSSNLVDWEFVADAFRTKPAWKNQGFIWAPDVTEVNSQFYMYYSYSLWGDPNPGIGLAIADSPSGHFIDQGKIFLSDEIGVANSIDPFYIEEDGKKYLFWGSFHGIFAIQLSEDGKSVTGQKIKIAHTHLEAAYIHRKQGYYYLFGSTGSCCEGANSTYKVLVARSGSLLGPYSDEQGNDLVSGPYGELLIQGNDEAYGFAGPGHNAEIITDDEGTDWFLYHAIKKSNPKLDNGASRRPLMLDKIIWKDGWPVIEGQEPSLTTSKRPVFK